MDISYACGISSQDRETDLRGPQVGPVLPSLCICHLGGKERQPYEKIVRVYFSVFSYGQYCKKSLKPVVA